MRFRRSAVADLPAYIEVRRESIGGIAGTHYTPEQVRDWIDTINEAAIADLIGDGRFFVGVDNGGAAACFGMWAGREVDHFYVSPAFKRRGWGRALLSCIENDYIRDTGNGFIEASAANNACAFYEACGYKFIKLVNAGEEGRIPYSYSVMRKEFE